VRQDRGKGREFMEEVWHVSDTPRLSDRSPGVSVPLSWETPGDALRSTTGVSETCQKCVIKLVGVSLINIHITGCF
jgi:hypothetical protein